MALLSGDSVGADSYADEIVSQALIPLLVEPSWKVYFRTPCPPWASVDFPAFRIFLPWPSAYRGLAKYSVCLYFIHPTLSSPVSGSGEQTAKRNPSKASPLNRSPRHHPLDIPVRDKAVHRLRISAKSVEQYLLDAESLFTLLYCR